MTDTDVMRRDHPEWLVWHIGLGAGRWGAMHRNTGLTVVTDSSTALGAAMTALQDLVRAGDEGPEVWNGVNQALRPESRNHLTGRSTGNPELLDEGILGGNGVARSVDAGVDAVAEFVGDLHPDGHVTPVVDHEPNVVDHGCARLTRYDHERPWTRRTDADDEEPETP